MSSPPPLLLSVSRAMPEAIRAVPDLSHCINSFLLPRTVDAAVYNDLPGVLRSFEAFLPWTFRAMDGAAARGRLDIVQTLLDTRTEGCSTQAFVGAAANGHVAVLRKLKWNYPELFDLRDCVTAAAEHGNVEVLEGLKPWPCNLNRAVCAAAARGHVHVLESFYRENRSLTFLSGDALEDIGVRGTCAVVEFLFYESLARPAEMVSAAARNGHIQVVALLWRKLNRDELESAMKVAAANDHADVVELLRATMIDA
ncbi:Myosin light chain kinase-related [Phytophthora cinnamomi]|uniref:Myosin light chain kinase-related n=1 Tax=Phytophthora cinnamomi TaxID=4785 RepID=UPI003559DA99|nr:Myosin light chain kinase-related [Phytophthora cinnamomi]